MFVFTDELRSYLHARSREDIEKDTRPYQTKQRSVAKAWVEREGGLETLFASSSFLENAKYRHDRPSARELADLLLLAPDDVRARCESQAETTHWPKGDFTERIFLLGCFPHRTDWASQLYAQHTTVPGIALGWQAASLLLGTLRDRDAILALAKARGVTHEIVNLLPDLREGAASLLIEALPFATSSGPQHAVATGLACIGTPEVAAVFAKSLRRSTLRPHALKFFARFPHLASDALSALAKNRKTQAGEVAHAILEMLERANERAADGTVAEEGELPALLREPPWRESPKVEPRAPRTRKPRVVIDLAKPMTPLRLHWPSDARRRWVAHRLQDVLLHPDEDELATLRADLDAKNETRVNASCPKEILFPLLEDVPENVTLWHATPGHVLALYGEEALAVVVNGHAELLNDELRLFVESPLLAIVIAGHDLHRVSQIEAALRWIERYPFAAARGLIWAAFSRTSKKEQAGAAIGLRHLTARGHAGAIEEAIASYEREAAETWSDEAALEIRRIAASEPEQDKLLRAPKLPAFYRPAEYRPPRLLSGKVLSLDAMQRLDELICAYATEQPPWPRFEEVRRAFDARSLAEHAWDLAHAWDLNNAPATSKWMLHAVRHFGDDEVVRRLTPALKDETYIPAMLADLGTDAAAMELLTIHARMRRSSPSSRAATQDLARITEHLERIVATRGLSAIEDLVDRFVPTYRVDDDGTIALDLGRDGPWRVTWNERLDRVLLDERGEVASTLPRTKADPDKLRAAVTLLADLDEDVATIAELRATALERAMVTGRTWPYEHFREAWLAHPIMRHMARGVVWEARLANGVFRTFRIAEDSSFADETDEHVELPPEEGVMIGVYHPARHRPGAAPVQRWRAMLADYKLLQPFEQLAREPPAPMSGEGDQLEWTRNRVTAAPRGGNYYRFLRAIPQALERAGWVGGARDNRDLRLPFEQAYGAMYRDDRTVSVWVIRDGKRVSFRDVDDVVRCELLRALDLVASGEGDT